MDIEHEVKTLMGAHEIVRTPIPQQLAVRLVAAGRRRFGTINKAELLPKTVALAAAYGIVYWEQSLKRKERKNKTPTKK